MKPRCGRMVGFSSGGENPHGVRAVTRGQRCAVALWFTLDPLYRELVRKLVRSHLLLNFGFNIDYDYNKNMVAYHCLLNLYVLGN